MKQLGESLMVLALRAGHEDMNTGHLTPASVVSHVTSDTTLPALQAKLQ